MSAIEDVAYLRETIEKTIVHFDNDEYNEDNDNSNNSTQAIASRISPLDRSKSRFRVTLNDKHLVEVQLKSKERIKDKQNRDHKESQLRLYSSKKNKLKDLIIENQ